MDVAEYGQIMAQLARERAALDATYAEIQEGAKQGAEHAQATGEKRPQEELIPELVQLVFKLGNFVNMERDHANKLYRLLQDTMERLAEAYELPLPDDWPKSQ